jgi:hypothetical protein
MGFLFKGTCYPDLPTVKAEQCSQAGQAWGAGTSQYTVECTSTSFTSTSMAMCRRLNGGNCTNYSIPYHAYPSCRHDGSVGTSLDFFGALLSFLVIIFVAARIYKIFWRSHESL